MNLLKTRYFVCCVGATLLISAVHCTRRAEKVCRPDKQSGNGERFFVIANTVSQFNVISNCTVIEGSLRIYWMTEAKEADFQNISFPDLVEITDYLLLYRISGLVSLGTLFPNLRVIRGQQLLFTYALVVYELDDLESIGLSNLAVIENGALLFEKNPNLCYVNTIDWSLIVRSTDMAPRDDLMTSRQNKLPLQCHQVENCPHSCPIGDRNAWAEQKLCWDDNSCQKVCQETCPQGCVTPAGPCCHSECIGGCTGPRETDCVACQRIFHDGACMARCPPDLYKLAERRCVSKDECRKLDVLARPRVWWKMHNEVCTNACPSGFAEFFDDKNICVPCNGSCLKECSGGSIETVAQSKKFKGCTRVNGYLEIRIMSPTRNIAELEENLGDITEVVRYVKIVRSQGLKSLNFLRRLSTIRGQRKDNEKYALYIFENPSLESLWDIPLHQNLTIHDGTFFVHMNSKLCYKSIENLIAKTTFMQNHSITEFDVSKTTNGNKGNCEDQVLNVTVEQSLTSSIHSEVTWTAYNTSDQREVIGYSINYRQVEDSEVVTSKRTDENGDSDKWKVVDVVTEDKSRSEYTESVETLPFVRYALYVATYTISISKAGGKSPIIYFRTSPDNPSPPADVAITSNAKLGPRALRVTWKPPKKPSGIVTEYYVYYRKQKLKPYKNRDYCTLQPLGIWRRPYEAEDSAGTVSTAMAAVPANTSGGSTCACDCIQKPRSSQDMSMSKLEKQQILSYAVENFIQDLVFVKGPDFAKGKRSIGEETEKSLVLRKKRGVSDMTSPAIDEVGDRRGKSLNDDVPKHLVVRNGTSAYLLDLEPSRYYSVEVLACHDYDGQTGRKLCSVKAISGGSTLPDSSLDVIQNDTFDLQEISVNGSSHFLELSWAEPLEANETNGHIIAYEVETQLTVEGKQQPPSIACINQTTFHDNNNTYVKEVKPGNYSFRVRLISIGLQGPWTPPRAFSFTTHVEGEIWTPLVITFMTVGILAVVVGIPVAACCIYRRKKLENQIPRDILYASMNPDYWDANEVYMPDEWEINRTLIKLKHELGQGSFGMVYEGLASAIPSLPDATEVKVAVKTVNEGASIRDRISFLKEASVMKAFCCPHIVKLLGVVSKGQPTLVIMELMSNGDLKNYLRMHRPDEPDNNGRQPPTIRMIWRMAAEIADGMSYLAAKKFVHRDLAARNCMVSEDMTVKIGDFGMTRDIYETDYYRKGSKGLLPVRWMAPESLKDGVFTSSSDVWSYGVVLWEMATLAAQPYQGLSNEQVLKYVIDENVMEPPEGCPERLFQLMYKCWQYRPKNRLTFGNILEHLRDDLHVDMPSDFWYFENKQTFVQGDDISDGEEADTADGALETDPLQCNVSVAAAEGASKPTSQLTSGYNTYSTGSAAPSVHFSALAAGCNMASNMASNGHVHMPSDNFSEQATFCGGDGQCSDSCLSSDETEHGDDADRAALSADDLRGGVSECLTLRRPSCDSSLSTSLPSAAPSRVSKGSSGVEAELMQTLYSKASVRGSQTPKFNCSDSSKESSLSHGSSSKGSCNGSANGHVVYMPRTAEC